MKKFFWQDPEWELRNDEQMVKNSNSQIIITFTYLSPNIIKYLQAQEIRLFSISLLCDSEIKHDSPESVELRSLKWLQINIYWN